MYNFAFGLSCLYFNFKSRIVLVKKTETAHAVWSMVKSKDISMQSGLGWDDNPRHIKGVYSTRSLRHIESSKFNNLSLERSNGRCPGCDYIKSRGDLVSIDCILLGMINYAV